MCCMYCMCCCMYVLFGLTLLSHTVNPLHWLTSFLFPLAFFCSLLKRLIPYPKIDFKFPHCTCALCYTCCCKFPESILF
ncbi:hypothetical protein HYPBUDRAFT_209369 [Hyphopichia burtonii NRRL Y-1933]|uniref:Uncharacterized protein n=1 Tax=Hyphopichia burtonii NRRL Y-1933 TaxID=984485 RepID=A0A1E4RJ28_9ASCO|nr:hypothetical protein HYPBUDRAFT_209369 [Hyphopichia burtonii NRRL Y-1933]ODV67253.1 hypothetical protein HYPBUDRAFT_209369 [Hyphopichia burtonii NRRL Y-1933]